MATLGFDPEFFFTNKEGKFISAVGLVGGSKDNPMPIGNGCFVQEDNVAVEFNTPPVDTAGKSLEEIAKEIHGHFQYVFNWVEENVCKKHGLVISRAASAIFDEDQLQTEAAQTFGCDPDYNAYTGDENPKPKGPQGLRTCGGHIHIGYENPDKHENVLIIQHMDYNVGVDSVLDDTDTMRRVLYGKAGAFRHKSYGVEYRTLSNYWIFEYESIRKIVDGLPFMQFNGNAEMLNDDTKEAVVHAINYTDKWLAKAIQKGEV